MKFKWKNRFINQRNLSTEKTNSEFIIRLKHFTETRSKSNLNEPLLMRSYHSSKMMTMKV